MAGDQSPPAFLPVPGMVPRAHVGTLRSRDRGPWPWGQVGCDPPWNAADPSAEGEEEEWGRKVWPGSAPRKSAQHPHAGLRMRAGDSGGRVAPLGSLMGNEGREGTALTPRWH